MRAPAPLAEVPVEMATRLGTGTSWLQEMMLQKMTELQAPIINSAVFCIYPFRGPGPAARTFPGTSNFLMFMANRADRSAAHLSYAALSFRASRPGRNSAVTPVPY